MEKELRMINDLQEISRLEGFIEELGTELSLSPDVVMEIRLALEEAVVNIINYAYPSNEKKDIQLYASYKESELTFLLTDSGKPFDPTLIEEVDITLGIDERPVGGLGMFIVQQIMNEVSYQRIGGENHLTLKKRTNQ